MQITICSLNDYLIIILERDLTMGPKYEFTSETKTWNDLTLYRIRRLSDGELGEYVDCVQNAIDAIF